MQEIFARFARTSVLQILFDSENSRCKAVFLLMWNKVIAIKVGLQFLKLLTLIAFAFLQYCGCWFFFLQELKFFENTGETDSRKFVSVMTNFHNLASYNFSEIEEAKGEIKKKVTGWFHVKPIACTHQHLYYSLMNHKEECNNNPILLKHKPLLCFRISQCNSVIEVCALVRLIIIMIMDIHVQYCTL